MFIQEFARVFCSDIIERSKSLNIDSLVADFPYDDIIYDEDGTPVKVVNSHCVQIPLIDILALNRSEFAKLHPDEESLNVFDRYISSIEMFEGEEAVNRVRNAVRREMERLDSYADLTVKV